MYDHEEELIDMLCRALVCAEADIEGIIEVDLVGMEHPIHQTLRDIQKVLAKAGR